MVRDDGRGDDNPRFEFDQDRWRVPSDGLDGFGGVEYDVSTQPYAQYDGSYLLSERVPETDRTIVAHAWFDPREARAEAERFFIPRRQYEVHVTYMGRTRYFTGRQYAFELSTGNVWGRLELTWTCLSIDPMWFGEDEHSFDIVEAERKFRFPFLSFAERVAPQPGGDEAEDGPGPASAPAQEAETGSEFVERHIAGFLVGVTSQRIRFENAGASVTYPRFDISATGDVANPSVTVEDESGETVCEFGIAVTLHDGDLLVVDFSARPTTIELNGENVSHLVTAGSTLATGVEVGEFWVTWSAESGDASLHVVPSVRERYVSI